MNREPLLRRTKTGLVILNKSVNMLILAVIVAAIALSLYALTDISRVIVQGSPEQYSVYKPGEEKKSFEELIEINPEVIGWINIYGTKIDYPITHAKDNEKYLMLGPDLQFSLLGSIFLDANNKPDFSDFNSILYGHNMTPRAMFGNIKDYKDAAYFDAHRYGDLFYGNKHHGIVIFAMYEEDGYSEFLKRTEFHDDEGKQSYLDTILEKAIAKRDIQIDVAKDRIVTLYTCSNVETNGRQLLVGLITDQTYESPYGEEAESETLKKAKGFLKMIPLWLWPFLFLLLLLIILLIMKHMEASKEQKKREELERKAKEIAERKNDG